MLRKYVKAFVCWSMQLSGLDSLACILKIFSVLSVKKSCELILQKNSFHLQVCQCRVFQKGHLTKETVLPLLCRWQGRMRPSKQSPGTLDNFLLFETDFPLGIWYLNYLCLSYKGFSFFAFCYSVMMICYN